MDQIRYIHRLISEIDRKKLNIRDLGVYIFIKEKIKVTFWIVDINYSRSETDYDSLESLISSLELMINNG